MTKKPLPLDAGLVRKGEAMALTGLPQRSAAPVEPPAATAKQDLVPLNFKVPAEFREAFETYAFHSQPRRKLVAVLKDAFEALREKEGR